MLLEVRVPLPYTVDDFRVGSLYCNVREAEVTIASGVRCKSRELILDEDGREGLHTVREFCYGSFFPKMLVKLMPKLKDVWFTEDCTQTYPDTATTTYSDFFGDKFRLQSRSKMVPNDSGRQANIFNLDDDSLAMRQVVEIDLLHTENSIVQADKLTFDVPNEYDVVKTKQWYADGNEAPSCSYTLMDIHISGFMQKKIEKMLAKDMVERLQIAKANTLVWTSEWKSMAMTRALTLDEEFECRAHDKQGFEPPDHNPESLRRKRHSVSAVEAPATDGAGNGADDEEEEDSSEIRDTTTMRARARSEAITSQIQQYLEEKRYIRRQVKKWYSDFCREENREPTNSEYARNLMPLFKRSQQLDILLRLDSSGYVPGAVGKKSRHGLVE